FRAHEKARPKSQQILIGCEAVVAEYPQAVARDTSREPEQPAPLADVEETDLQSGIDRGGGHLRSRNPARPTTAATPRPATSLKRRTARKRCDTKTGWRPKSLGPSSGRTGPKEWAATQPASSPEVRRITTGLASDLVGMCSSVWTDVRKNMSARPAR